MRKVRLHRLMTLGLIAVLASSMIAFSVPVNASAPTENSRYTTGQHTSSPLQPDNEECLVPCDEIVSGGPPQDGIPSIDNPKYYSVQDADEFISEDDRILAMEIEGQMYGFPHNILDWHEVVNHPISDGIMSITYCPLTGTGIPFHTKVGVGTSGKLFENNLVYYDRDTESYWSQMLGMAIMGERIGEAMDFENIIELKWKGFKNMYPDAQVLTRDTGYSRDYDRYPYQVYNYLTSETILFQSNYDKNSEPYNLYHPKDLTVVLPGEQYALFPFEELYDDTVFAVEHLNQLVYVFYDADVEFAVTFGNDYYEEPLELRIVSSTPYTQTQHLGLNIFEDQFGNVWNMNGEIIDGPDKDVQEAQMTHLPSYIAFWFAATAFFGNALIYSGENVLFYGIPPVTGSFTDKRLITLSFFPWVILALLPIVVGIKRRRS